jgi:hypothetical protein
MKPIVLPNEIIFMILQHLPVCELKNKAKLVSKTWCRIALSIIGERLAGLATILNVVKASNSKLQSVFDPHGVPNNSNEEPKAFSCWLLGNFDHQEDSHVVTGIEICLDGIDSSSGALEFRPSGLP